MDTRRSFLKKLAFGGAAAGLSTVIPAQATEAEETARKAFVSKYPFFVVEEVAIGTNEKPLMSRDNVDGMYVLHNGEKIPRMRTPSPVRHHTFLLEDGPLVLQYEHAIMEHSEVIDGTLRIVWAWSLESIPKAYQARYITEQLGHAPTANESNALTRAYTSKMNVLKMGLEAQREQAK